MTKVKNSSFSTKVYWGLNKIVLLNNSIVVLDAVYSVASFSVCFGLNRAKKLV